MLTSDIAERDDVFVAAAWEAVPAFGLHVRTITVLSRSENVVCDVTLNDGRHVALRLHRPGYNTIEELRSEVRWVLALRDADLPVPVPVPTVEGRYYTSIAVAGEVRHVGVIEWVDGDPLGGPVAESTPNVVAHYRRIGQLSAEIRSHGTTWQPPTGFTRRRWDADGLMGTDPLWGKFWEAEQLDDSIRALFAEARTVLHVELAALSVEKDRFGLIHADLHLGNLMATGPDLTMIDFDDSGFGWFAHELAVSLHPVKDELWYPEARTALLAGYRDVWPLDLEEEDLVDLFLVVRSLMIVGWLAARPDIPVYHFFAGLAEDAASMVNRHLGLGGSVGS
ncbi:MAG: Ser/Thr protein kinase RdoA (MazF antagonist) [Acidimicrobiales bacterium]|jgi:Ser/Thr protein kinase RdoA (MazF antagonist)